MKTYITGDTHGDFSFLEEFCRVHDTTINDVLIILGDAGILYYGAKSKKEKQLKTLISDCPITLFCVRGNHEDRAEDRLEMETKGMFGGVVMYDPAYPNIIYPYDGGTYLINGQKCLVIGGAYSVDKFYRLEHNWKWNSREQLDEYERDAIESFSKYRSYDHILAHTCPYSWEPTYLFLNGIDQSTVDNTMERWLERIVQNCHWKHYWFGHFHGDNMDVCGDGKVHMLFQVIKELKV